MFSLLECTDSRNCSALSVLSEAAGNMKEPLKKKLPSGFPSDIIVRYRLNACIGLDSPDLFVAPSVKVIVVGSSEKGQTFPKYE